MSYTGTKSYNSTFRDTGNQSESGQVVVLTGLTSDTNYSIVVIATNTAGFRNSSDPEFGITLTGRKLPPHTLLSSTSPPLTLTLPTVHLFTITPPHTTCLFYPLHICLLLIQITFLPPPAPPPLPPPDVPPTSPTTVPRTYRLIITRGSNLGGQIRLG